MLNILLNFLKVKLKQCVVYNLNLGESKSVSLYTNIHVHLEKKTVKYVAIWQNV